MAFELAPVIESVILEYGPIVLQQGALLADKVPAIWDKLLNNTSYIEKTSNLEQPTDNYSDNNNNNNSSNKDPKKDKDKKTYYEGKSRRDAFRQAKRDAEIPINQQPKRIFYEDLIENGKRVLDSNGNPIQTRNYYYINKNGEEIIIQEHSLGHRIAKLKNGGEPHFNIRPSNNIRNGHLYKTHGHYNFKK